LLAEDEDLVPEAKEQFDLAGAIARRQSARSLDLRVTMSLARLRRRQGRQMDAYRLLAESYSWFSEGFDTADLRAARKLLEELSEEST
jgi:predicted ATPase